MCYAIMFSLRSAPAGGRVIAFKEFMGYFNIMTFMTGPLRQLGGRRFAPHITLPVINAEFDGYITGLAMNHHLQARPFPRCFRRHLFDLFLS